MNPPRAVALALFACVALACGADAVDVASPASERTTDRLPAFGPPSSTVGVAPAFGAPSPTTAPTSSAPSSSSIAATPSASAASTDAEVPFSTGGTGHLDVKQIKAALHAKMPDVVACYSRAVQKSPSLHGQFVARFRIEPTGEVSRAETTGDRRDPSFLGCVSDVVRAVRFPKPKGGFVEVVYPLDFEAG